MNTPSATSQELWREIVLRTHDARSESIRALRIALFVWLCTSRGNSFRKQFRRALSALRMLTYFRGRDLPPRAGGPLVFCFPHATPSNMNNLLPLAREAQKRGLLGGIVAASSTLATVSEFREETPVVTLRELGSQLALGDRLRVAVEACKIVRQVSKILGGYDHALRRQFMKHIGFAFEEVVTSLELQLALRTLFEHWSPEAVVSTSDLWPFEYHFAHEASLRGIPSFVIQHGALAYFYWPFVADYYVLWGEQSREEMAAFGAPPERLLVGGMPASDTTFSRHGAHQNSRSTDAEPPVAVILSHTHVRKMEPELYESYGRFLSNALKLAPSIRWKVKLHPIEDQSFYETLAPEVFEGLEFFPKSATLNDALGEADVVITLYSTAGQEAMVAGLPVVVPVVSPRMEEPAHLPQVYGARKAYSPEEFVQALRSLVRDPAERARAVEQQDRALRRSFANQGHATEAILGILCRQVSSRKGPQPEKLEEAGRLAADGSREG